jgi:hypothetical protein
MAGKLCASHNTRYVKFGETELVPVLGQSETDAPSAEHLPASSYSRSYRSRCAGSVVRAIAHITSI